MSRQSADYMAGRLAAIIDILAYAAAVIANSDDVEKSLVQPYSGIITLLADGPLSEEELASWLEARVEATSAAVGELHDMRMLCSLPGDRNASRIVVQSPLGVAATEDTRRSAKTGG